MIYLFDSGVDPSFNFCTDYFSVTNDHYDRVGHGTVMASVIKSVHTKAKITSIKIGDLNPSLENILLALSYPESRPSQDKVNIILFNANFLNHNSIVEFESKLLDLSKKFTVVVPAGNNADCVENYTPARCNFIWNVGGLNKSKEITSVSNFQGSNRKIDFWVVSTNITATNNKNEKVKVFGTSVAASITAALIDKNQTLDKNQIENLIEEFNASTAIY